jgi:hypothetical protein
MDLLNAILTGLTSLLWVPLAPLPAWLVLVVWSALAAVLAGSMFRYTSNQRALADVGDRVRANLLGMRLFKEELGVTLRCQAQLLRAAVLRFWYALPAFAAMLVPFVLLLVQLALRYEYRPLTPDESAVVVLRVAPEDWPHCRQAGLELPDGVVADTPALRDEVEHAIYWRIRPTQAGAFELRWQLGQHLVTKSLTVANDARRLCIVSPQRPGRGLWDRLLYAAEPALPADSPARAVLVEYPRRSTAIFGFDVPWWLTFLVLSIVIAVLLRPVLKVKF